MYSPTSDTLRKHRERLLQIALDHARSGGLNSLNRERIAAAGGVSLGTVSNALGKRADMIQLVMEAGEAEGETLKWSNVAPVAEQFPKPAPEGYDANAKIAEGIAPFAVPGRKNRSLYQK
jgi:hypothetical protein